jgi:hypothetical protein
MPTLKNTPLIFALGMFLTAGQVQAGCEVTPTNIYLGPSISTTFQISVKNTGDTAFAWVKIPVDNMSVISSIEPEIVDSGWVAMFGAEADIFSDGRIEPGDTTRFNIRANTTSEEDNFDWIWETSIFNYGSPSEICNPVNIAVTNNPPMPSPTPIPLPVISEMTVAAGPSTATIGWRSDVDSNGSVDYGTTSGYGSSKAGQTGVQSHSVTLTGLTPETTYHYRVSSTTDNGSTITTDNTFVTAVAGTTTVTTNTVTNVVTNTNTQTINQTVILADKSKPTVNVSTKIQKTYKEAPIIEGKVVDTGAINAGIAKIQYSIDDGKNWLMVEEPNGARSASFNFVPEIYDDGNYVLLVKATDLTGNTGVSSKQTLVIDRLPPKVIHSVWRVGPIVLSAPYPLLPGVTTNVSIQAIGGVIELSLLINEQEYKFNKNSENGLWEGEVKIEWGSNPVLQYSGVPVIVRARDGGRNKIEEKMGEISLPAQAGEKVKQDVNVTVYRYDEMTKRFKKWNGAIYGQNNPKLGKFDWFLPEGKYYFKESLKRYQSGVTEIFEIQKPSIVSVFGQLEKWSIANFWRSKKLAVSNSGSLISKNDEQLVGRVSKWVEDSEYRGKEFNLNIVASWDPGFATILSGLKTGDLVIVPGANQSSMDLVKMRGGYSIDLIGDPDGTILDDFKETVLPVSININRRGQVVR